MMGNKEAGMSRRVARLEAKIEELEERNQKLTSVLERITAGWEYINKHIPLSRWQTSCLCEALKVLR